MEGLFLYQLLRNKDETLYSNKYLNYIQKSLVELVMGLQCFWSCRSNPYGWIWLLFRLFFCDNLWLSPYIVPLNSSHIRIPKSQSCRSTSSHVTTNWKLALFPLDTQLCHKGPCFLSHGPGVCNALEMNPQSLDVALCSTLQFQPWGATWEYQPSLLFKTKAQG